MIQSIRLHPHALRYALIAGAVVIIGIGTAEGTAYLLSGAPLAKEPQSSDAVRTHAIPVTARPDASEFTPQVASKHAKKKAAPASKTGLVGTAGPELAASKTPAGVAPVAASDEPQKTKSATSTPTLKPIAPEVAVSITKATSTPTPKGTPTPDPARTPAPIATATPAPQTVQDQSRVVSNAYPLGWRFAPQGDNQDPTLNGTVNFSFPPAPSPLGNEALELLSTTGKSVVAYLPLPASGGNPRLSDLTEAGFSAYVKNQPSPGADVTMQFEVTGSTSTYFDNGYTTLVFDPDLQPGSNPIGRWNRYSVLSSNAGAGAVYSTQAGSSSYPSDCTAAAPCSITKWMSENPSAVVQTVKLRAGQNNGDGYVNFDAFVDDVRLSFDSTSVHYDMGA